MILPRDSGMDARGRVSTTAHDHALRDAGTTPASMAIIMQLSMQAGAGKLAPVYVWLAATVVRLV